jgi:hypothetical protein
VWGELRKPRNLARYLRKSGDVTVPLLFAGPTLVLLAYVAAFAATPGDRTSTEFGSAASQIIPVLLLVLAIEGRVFRWEIGSSAVTSHGREELAEDVRFRRFADRDGPIDEAVDAVLDAYVDAARNIADTLLRQVTALLLLGALLLGEIVALVPLLTDDPASGNPRPVMAAIVAGFAGVAYVAITGSRFLNETD